MQSHPVMPYHHLARGFGMHRVSIVQQRRSEHSCGVNGEPKESNDQQRTTLTQMECGGRLQGRNVGTGMALPYRYRRAHARFRKKFIIRVLCQVSELEPFRLWHSKRLTSEPLDDKAEF